MEYSFCSCMLFVHYKTHASVITFETGGAVVVVQSYSLVSSSYFFTF